MSVDWHGDRTLAAVRAGVVTGLVRGTEAVKAEAVSLQKNSPRSGRTYRHNGVTYKASAPGEPPAPDTGTLLNSISAGVDSATLTGTVGVSAAYGKYLEFGTRNMAPRPFMRPAIANKRDEIAADIADEIGKALR